MTTSNTDTGDTVINVQSETEVRNMSSSGAGGAGVAAEVKIEPAAPREALITTAVNFLQNAKVRHTTLMQKQQFLKSKGLTTEEIQLACERAGVFSQDPNAPTVVNMGVSAQAQTLALQPRLSAFGRIKEVLHSMALLSGVAWAIFMFWKRYVEPFLFGRKKKKPVEDTLQDIDTKVETRMLEVNRELTHIKESLVQQQRDQLQQFTREFNVFRSDLEAIKGLLLNRKQFASPLTAGPPSIPAWQLVASSSSHRHRHSQSDDNEKHDDAGSGSGSSETEVVTKNSDSSLEIM